MNEQKNLLIHPMNFVNEHFMNSSSIDPDGSIIKTMVSWRGKCMFQMNEYIELMDREIMNEWIKKYLFKKVREWVIA